MKTSIESNVHPRSKSANFMASVITLLMIALGAIGITTDLDPDMTTMAFISKNWGYIIETTVPSLVVLVTKTVGKAKAGEWDWSKIKKSWNFWTFTITVVLNGLTLVFAKLAFDENASQLIIDAVQEGSIFTIIAVVFAQVINPIVHFIRDRKKGVPEDAENVSGRIVSV